jgi:hypothetical protein
MSSWTSWLNGWLPAPYFGDPEFDSRSGDRLSRCVSWFFLVPSSKCWNSTLKCEDHSFCIISYNLPIRRFIIYAVEKVSLNKVKNKWRSRIINRLQGCRFRHWLWFWLADSVCTNIYSRITFEIQPSHNLSWSRGSSGSIVSDYGLDDRGSIPDGGRGFFFLLALASRPALGPTQFPVQWVPGVLSSWVKRGQGVMLPTHPHLVPRLRMSRSYTSSPLKRLHGV